MKDRCATGFFSLYSGTFQHFSKHFKVNSSPVLSPLFYFHVFRDDDNDKSEDEDDERVDFSVNNAARERQQLRDNFLAAEQGS